MVVKLSIAVHVFPIDMLTSLSVDSRSYPAETITVADDADVLALLPNTP